MEAFAYALGAAGVSVYVYAMHWLLTRFFPRIWPGASVLIAIVLFFGGLILVGTIADAIRRG